MLSVDRNWRRLLGEVLMHVCNSGCYEKNFLELQRTNCWQILQCIEQPILFTHTSLSASFQQGAKFILLLGDCRTKIHLLQNVMLFHRTRFETGRSPWEVIQEISCMLYPVISWCMLYPSRSVTARSMIVNLKLWDRWLNALVGMSSK